MLSLPPTPLIYPSQPYPPNSVLIDSDSLESKQANRKSNKAHKKQS